MKRILFVCSGNICRSPTAEGVARHLATKTGLNGELEFDSAGTGSYHVGDPPDPRAVSAAAARGYNLTKLRARRVESRDFETFDLILAMDHGHLKELRRMCPAELHHKILMFTNFAEHFPVDEDVPDPYYGGDDGFVHVLDLCEDSIHGILHRYG